MKIQSYNNKKKKKKQLFKERIRKDSFLKILHITKNLASEKIYVYKAE